VPAQIVAAHLIQLIIKPQAAAKTLVLEGSST
jgi:hypothetical protein